MIHYIRKFVQFLNEFNQNAKLHPLKNVKNLTVCLFNPSIRTLYGRYFCRPLF